jgi:hypothetical protein
MKQQVQTPEQYIDQLPEDRKTAIGQLIKTIGESLPKGFSEIISYGMIGFVIPHSIYPNGYHVDPRLPLPFISIASQKNYIALYHMGLYSSPELLEWFTREYPKHSKTKLDMGKSCIRFKKSDQIPLKLIGELCSKITTEEWIEIYESHASTRTSL